MEMDSLLDRVVKKEDEFDQSKTTMLLEDYVVENNNDLNHSNNKSVSIAERRAAKCGFNASNINDAPFRTTGLPAAASPSIRSPYFFTVPPGLSPSALLDSPIMLPNSQAQLSPTTGTFQFPSLNHDNLKLKLKLATNGGDNSVDTECSSTFNPHQGFTHSISENLRVENEQFDEYKYTSDFQEMAKKDCYEGLEENKSSCLQQPSNISTAIATNQTFNHNNHHTVKERITHQNPEKRQKVASSIPKDMAKYSEDGYYWRKYGQKQVKGSEYPRSYFKCTNTNCLVKKKVERSHDGQITEIVYKGSHNHPKSQPAKGGGSCVRPEGGNKDIVFGSDWRNNGVDNGTSSMPFMGDFSDPSLKDQFEPVQDQTQELSSTFGSQDGEDQNGASPDSISFNEDDEENGECEPKRRKRDTPNETTISRSTREPRVVVQIESNIDILDDGYRWRKYGQKVVKGNPNPRSYYKCTTPGCPVRKHVERAANDIKSVVTTYEGKHNHEVPSSKNGTLVISDAANLPSTAMNNTLSTSSTMAHKSDIPRSGKQAQDLPLYMERKPPLLNYNEMMRSSNLPGNFPGADLNFGTSSIYPLSFPPFPSIPYNPLLLNGNHHHHHHHMKTFSSSNLYPMLPDYMTLPTPMNQAGVHVPLGGNFQVNNYQAFQPSIPGQEMKVVDCQAKGLRPKEEQRDDGDIYSSCLSIQNHGNGAM